MTALLEVRDLHTSFPMGSGRAAVVKGVNLRIERGEVLALVGESGCGKSMTALSILRLVPKPAPLGVHGVGFTPADEAKGELVAAFDGSPGRVVELAHHHFVSELEESLAIGFTRQNHRIRIFEDVTRFVLANL